MIRVLIIEDEIIIARYIQQLLQGNFDWNVRIAVNVEEASKEMGELRPQLVLCDINLGNNADGIDLVSGFLKTHTFETIFITSYQSKGIIERAALVRPVNFIIKPLDETQFLATMTMTGVRLAPAPVAEQPLAAPPKEVLTRSEYEVLQLIAGNRSTREIASTLHISPLTVKNHRHNICRKLNLPPGNNSILRWAMDHKGLL